MNWVARLRNFSDIILSFRFYFVFNEPNILCDLFWLGNGHHSTFNYILKNRFDRKVKNLWVFVVIFYLIVHCGKSCTKLELGELVVFFLLGTIFIVKTTIILSLWILDSKTLKNVRKRKYKNKEAKLSANTH